MRSCPFVDSKYARDPTNLPGSECCRYQGLRLLSESFETRSAFAAANYVDVELAPGGEPTQVGLAIFVAAVSTAGIAVGYG